jgi:hypothetical protein
MMSLTNGPTNSPNTPLNDDDIVVVEDPRVGTPDAIIGEPTSVQPPITYQPYDPNNPPASFVLMTKGTADASGYILGPPTNNPLPPAPNL